MAKTRGEHLQEAYDLAALVVESLPAIRGGRDLFGPADGQPTRTVLGKLWEDARPQLEVVAREGSMQCGMCPFCLEAPPDGESRPCPLALTDLVEAFKAGARDMALKRELAPALMVP